ncbi:hypothetical protein LAP8965_02172 [Lactiplantibacillus plantarum]|uniref:phage tail protein n=1 Tax=Lactiplantibacillus plantarum TaxID=1590 RepID=UPI000CF9C201|nr:phage tail protein [Lactiplantibacillus plantarum]SPE08100.1 hypothetical protein LAP8963_02224 [Lactiplantibacillus plantarum]SPE12121.1 hypothetical protein LAP8964_02036 [Lactiplantibacillus plantarum]SPH06841.1 hypothetical protein LAP8965_02172 [Lactiplantibacillus plantarum]SPH09989.1 hypothetical protein LAP8966_02179 [Lactiplantibacillus plantarum]
MAESNATQVILTDDGLKIIKAQNTADNAVSGVTDLNDPNLMSVIEKQNNIGQFAGLTSQYNVLVQNAKDEGINTDSLTDAYNNLNKFMADVLTDSNHASDVDRNTYKNYQDAYNSELAKIQTALKNNADNKFTSAASATSQAASMANLAKSAADSSYDYANSEMTVQSQATDKAQSAADSAFSQAQKAIDTGNVTSQAVTDLKDGSKLTIADLENGLATKVANSAYASYKDQTAGQIASKVDNGAFQTYKSQTTTAISSKVDNGAFQTYKSQTTTAISSKVDNGAFNTYKTQTADTLQTLVSRSPLNIIKDGGFNSAVVGQIPSGWDFTGTAQIAVNSDNTNDLVATGHSVLQINSKTQGNSDIYYGDWFDVQPGDQFYAELKARWSSMSQKGAIVLGVVTQDATGTWMWTGAVTIGSPSNWAKYTGVLTIPNGAVQGRVWVSWQGSAAANESVFVTDLVVRPAYSTQSDITQLSDDINLRVTKDGLISEINLQAGNGGTLISSSGQLTLSGKTVYFDTTNPVIIPSANMDTVLVKKKLTGADISANTFSTNNETFIVDSNGAITAKNMTLTGGTLTTPTINAGTINGSTINGTTFHGGDIINDANNTSQFYPTTIASNGHIYTTMFNSADAMQTDLSTGSLTTKYRATNSSGSQYEAYDTNISADQIVLSAGHTNGKDMSFSQSVTGSNQDGYVWVSPLNGLTFHGDNQQITFNGTSDDVTPKGVIITPYGNINPNGTQNIWYVGNGPTMKTASFGMDGSGTYNIQFNRSLDIGNFNINTYHTITSSDNGPIHFNRNDGNSVDIYAATVHYTSLVKSSLLSVKQDVKKADTAYWAQLVNSIDLATYQYKSDDNTSHIRLSSIVDDVNDTKQWQLPDVFISRDEDGKLSGVDDSVLLNATLATVQEQQKQIDQLNGHNMELEARLNKLEAKLNG